MRNVKIIGLLAVSAMALVALVGTASASAASFTAGKLGKTLTTTTNTQHVFVVTKSEVKCAISKFEGVTEGGAEEAGKFHSTTQKVHPVYKECEAFGFPATVTTNPSPGCIYTFASGTDAASMAQVTISGCTTKRTIVNEKGETETEGGKPVEKEGILISVAIAGVANCEVLVPNQAIASAVNFANVAGPAIKVTATATGIEADVVKSTGSCPLKLGTHTNALGNGATYNGASTVSAEGGIEYTP